MMDVVLLMTISGLESFEDHKLSFIFTHKDAHYRTQFCFTAVTVNVSYK
jgi:hypothetical protein